MEKINQLDFGKNPPAKLALDGVRPKPVSVSECIYISTYICTHALVKHPCPSLFAWYDTSDLGVLCAWH